MVDPLCEAVMRGVARSGVMGAGENPVTETKIEAAVEIMRSELKAFLCEERYADARVCVMTRSLNDAYIVSLIVAECVAKIAAIPAPQGVGATGGATAGPAPGNDPGGARAKEGKEKAP